MIRQRRNSQKPGDDLLANFRHQFPEVATTTTTTTVRLDGVTADVGDAHLHNGEQAIPHEGFRDQDPTPRATSEQWRFTPLLDSNNFTFPGFNGNGAGGFYAPTPGGTGTVYHPQAGDLHTPTMGLGMGLNTPLSLTTTAAVGMPNVMANGTAPMMPFTQFQPAPMGHQYNGYVANPAQAQGFAPSTFVHSDTGYETMDQDGSPLNGGDLGDDKMGALDGTFPHIPPLVGMAPGNGFNSGMHMSLPLPPSAEKFRWHTTLNAPTAMIKHADEIPITYLNKGQAYSLSVIDTGATLPLAPGTRYRTFVRVSFEDERQRQKPSACWSLWKEGRGTNEAHQRGGKLQAVEFVEAKDPGDNDDKRTRVELESSSFDGFSVIWTPGASGMAEVSIAVRFNFLSTDFSHSKGVKGIPVRLCAKTGPYPGNAAAPTSSPAEGDSSPEICYCKAKLFRDHGAERKLSNDIAHVKKTIDKLKQQIAQVESGMKDFGKRKRSGGAAAGNGLAGGAPKVVEPQRPGKVQKHKRTWSVSSASSSGGAKPPAEDDWHTKLQALQDMFTSTRPVSILFLRGEDLDDPDLHPVSLPGQPDFSRLDAREGPNWQARSGRSSVASSSLVSPSTRSPSLASVSRVGTDASAQWGRDDSEGKPYMIKKSEYGGNLNGWIEALGVDPSYRPPPEPEARPVACFFVAHREAQGPHKAVYLMRRTVADFKNQVAAKWDVDPRLILRLTRVTPGGVEVEIDDDVVRETKEGQDMTLEVVERGAAKLKTEWEMMIDTGDDEGANGQQEKGRGYELRFHF
ncbi:related to transcription factor BOM [Cephalotrichum gorgonifer]|uniref:Related to transcription factor BOM n=1 Tax=Cephalotrichum gorgonifer TaxID=2041049 RepID=A0AAE8N5I8_9PEZI|nr:related to transcription factor BOM [Cephalotrichum gorgonifer]